MVDLRSLLEERCEDDMPSMPMSPSSSDSHLFLILDKGLHSFPWESLPCLANSSVSRLPSLDYLRDRLQLRNYKSYKDNSSYPGLTVDGRKLFYLLNPGGDLLHTQREFHDLLQAKKWAGIVGKAPMEEEMRRQLSTQDLFLWVVCGRGVGNLV